jgi:hypothetical protein
MQQKKKKKTLKNKKPPTDLNEKINDVTDWTKDTAEAYLKKYNIPHPQSKDESQLLQTVKYYRDSVAFNMDLFGEKVNRLLEGLKIKLEEQHHVSRDHVQALTDQLGHDLRSLEIRGELTRERVSEALDHAKHQALRKKWVTEAQWKQLANDLEASFTTESWYRRFLGKPHQRNPTDEAQDDDSGFHHWAQKLETKLKTRAQHNKELNEQQVQHVVDTVKHAMQSTPDVRKIGDKKFWHQVETNLQKQQKLRTDQAKAAVDALQDDIHAYRIFAMDYAGHAADATQSYVWSIVYTVRDTVLNFWDRLSHWWWRQYDEGHSLAQQAASSSHAISAAQSRSLESAVHAASSAAADKVNDVRDDVRDTAESWKQSFGTFWREKERQAYKRIGYTEAQLDWIQNHLEKSFQDRKSLAKHNVENVLANIRRYMLQARVQSAHQIDHQLTRLQNLLEAWKHALRYRDEL